MKGPVRNEQELLSILRKDIDSTNRDLKVFCGHLPLRYQDDGPGKREAYLDVTRWGYFSSFTFDLGSQLLRYALDRSKTGSLLVLVDDDIELPRKLKKGKLKREDRTVYKNPRGRTLRSSILPDVYLSILNKYKLSINNLVVQKRDADSTVLISEKRLKKEAKQSGLTAEDTCSMAYKGLLFTGKYFDPKRDHLIGFIPEQCKGSICDGVLDAKYPISASHVFFPDIEAMGALNECEAGYVVSTKREPLSLDDAFTGGKITYRKDKPI